MTSTVSALVPMKAHSERVPNKNIREFNGRPLYHWILATLQATETIDEMVINTDSDVIAKGAEDLFDATIIDRPESLRGDEVPMNDILLHDVSHVDADLYVQTHCTNPLLRPNTVDAAVQSFWDDPDSDSLFSVTSLQTRLWDAECEPINHERDQLLPTQELPPVYEENSNLYVFTRDSLERRENRIGDSPRMFEMAADEAVDIDEPLDFRFAEFLHRDRYGTEPDISDVVADE